MSLCVLPYGLVYAKRTISDHRTRARLFSALRRPAPLSRTRSVFLDISSMVVLEFRPRPLYPEVAIAKHAAHIHFGVI